MPTKVLKFEAEWCAPCDQQAAILEDFHDCPVEAVDIDEEQERAQEYNIRSVPTLVVCNDEGEYERFTGVTQLLELSSAVEQAAHDELQRMEADDS